MTDSILNYAQIATGETEVFNTIMAPSTFTLDGYTLVAIPSGVLCQPGNYYNAADSLFYEDAAFTTLSGAGSTIAVAGTPAAISDMGAS